MKVGIIGAGAWGAALGISVHRAGHDVVLWTYDNILPAGINIPKETLVTNDLGALTDAGVWVIATPSQFFAETAHSAKKSYNSQPVIIATKGLTRAGDFMYEIAHEVFGENVGVLAGVGFATELADGGLTGGVIAGRSEIIEAAGTIFADFVLDATGDVVGVQLCGAGKNAAAILMGYLDGQGAGENERALRISQIWGEIINLGASMGASIDTFLGLAGTGDLFLSATSKSSRNYKAGFDIANGKKPVGTIEGINAVQGLLELGKKAGIFMQNVEFLAEITAR